MVLGRLSRIIIFSTAGQLVPDHSRHFSLLSAPRSCELGSPFGPSVLLLALRTDRHHPSLPTAIANSLGQMTVCHVEGYMCCLYVLHWRRILTSNVVLYRPVMLL